MPGVSSERDARAVSALDLALDPASRRWIEQLRPGHWRHQEALARLQEILHRVAIHELTRRRGQLGAVAGPEFDDLAHQAADDALISILGKLDDFRGRSRFTTWAYKFAVFEVSAKVARHAWHHHAPTDDELTFARLPDVHAALPGEQLEQREQLETLSAAISELTDRQRQVFVAIALNDVSIDVLAVQMGTNRNAIYKSLFDARRRLRASLAQAGHPVGCEQAGSR
jgi:RNA polymerase sigma-70 factor, ECF subfamily